MALGDPTSLLIGNYVLIGCCVAYLIWWAIAFNPQFRPPMAPKVILFLVTLALGIAGIVFIVGGLASIQSAPVMPNYVIVIIGIALYALLLALTSKLLHRQVTTELLLIVGWMVLESCLINTLHGLGALNAVAMITALCIMIVGAGASLGCYLAYYNLKPMPAFYVGMVPLVLLGVAMLIINLLIS